MATNTSAPAGAADYTRVRFCVSAVSFSVLLFFNLIINWTILRQQRLRSSARFVLVFHLLASALVHLGTSTVFLYRTQRGSRPGYYACVVVIAILISSAANILLTLTAMALDRYCAVCHPMRYASGCAAGRWPWLLGLLTWLVSLTIPVGLLLFLRADSPDAFRGDCGPEQLRVGELHKVLFITVCTLVILYSYVRILVEGRRLGVLNRRNRAGCRTIALHGSQLAVYLLPNFVNFVLTVLFKRGLIRRETKELSAVVIFTFFSFAQCVAPVVYGLRKEELAEQVACTFPCFSRYLKAVVGWTVGAGPWSDSPRSHRERTLTAQTTVALEEEPGRGQIRRSSHDSQGRMDDTQLGEGRDPGLCREEAAPLAEP